jgi:autotransporter-associated beta strand protein
MSSLRSGILVCCLIVVAACGWLAFRTGNHESAEVAVRLDPAAALPPDGGDHAHDPAVCDHRHPVAAKTGPSLAVADDFLQSILSKDEKQVTIPLPGGGTAEGAVTSIKRDAKGLQYLEGKITRPAAGRFMFQRQTVPGKAGPFAGFILLEKGDTAWRIRPTKDGGKSVLEETHADSVICRALAAPEDTGEIPPTHPTDLPIPPDENGVIQLQSLPGAEAVVYLDFDGEERVFDSWGYVNAQPSGSSNAQIYEVWKGVCEDYMPFNINITTVRSVYDEAAEGRRIQVIVTPTNTVAPGAGGVAYVGSFNWSGEMVCWSFYSSGKNGVEVISHEVGHTLGLIHDGRVPSEAYYAGHPGWAPIMGVGYYQTPSQWSMGEYEFANNPEDDVDIIAINNNDTGFRADDHGGDYSTSSWLDITTLGAVSNEGVIGTRADDDSFRFTTTGGDLNLTVANVAFNPNLDIRAEILTDAGTLVSAVDPTNSLDASFVDVSLPAGAYFLRVSGVGNGDLQTGYSDYGSLGAFTVTGTIAGGVAEDRFSIAENSPNNSIVGAVVPRADHGGGVVSFACTAGNEDGAFTIDANTGVITVADVTKLDFEELSPRWDVPARYELFVEVTDSLSTATESIRTVIEVVDVNEAPDFSAPPAILIAEHTAAGTLVTAVSATDPDRADHISYSIVSGNTGGAFAIDPTTGAITVAGNLDFPTTPAYSLTLRATDGLLPANSVDVVLSVQVLDIAENQTPGSIVRTFYNDIAGQTIPSLTSHSRFPNQPNSEQFLTSFDSGPARGDNYGSTIRGYLIAPVTGSYTFWISADDSGELRISPDENPANAAIIANLTSATDPDVWNQPGQQSVTVNLSAGQSYYIEARHKEHMERDHLQIAWQYPGSGPPEIIPGRWLAPFLQDYAPWAAPASLVAREAAVNGQRIGTVVFVEPDIGQAAMSFAITGGNESGAFAINAFSGDITVANGNALVAGQSHVLTISATDNGSPQLTGQTTLTIPVLGLHEQLHTWWMLDEGSGAVVNDSSGNSHTASISGSPAWIQRDTANHSLSLNGTNARISYTGGDGLAGATSFTLAAWVKVPLNLTTDGMLIQQYKSGSSGHIGRYLAYVKADGKINFSVYGRDSNNSAEAYQFDITSGSHIKDNTWHHVACVRDGSTGRIYIDGVLAASGSGAIRMLDPSLTIAVGYDARNNNTHLKATVDDVRIYQDALSGQQLLRIAGTPKLSIITPTATATIPSGVGLVLETAASDPDGPHPLPQWTQVNGPDTAVLTHTSDTLTYATFPANGTYILRASVTDGTNTVTRDLSVLVGSTASSPYTGISYGGAFGSHFDYPPGTHALIGSSSGLLEGGTSDAFYLLGQSFTGDFDVRARITSATDLPETPNERAGLIIRSGTAGSVTETSGFIGMGAGDTGHWLRRENTGDPNLEDDYPLMSQPSWCRIVRTGSTVEFQHSPDGVSWTTRGTMTMPGTVRAGLCWSSGSASGFGSAAFDNVLGFSMENTGPWVDAGADVETTTGTAAALDGDVSDDGRPGPSAPTLEWSMASGPGAVSFSQSNAADTTVTCTTPGVHVLRLTADDGAVRTFDDLTLTAELPKVISVTATDASASETGPDSGAFVITRSGQLDGDLTVNLSFGGSATPADDYSALPASIVIPSGETTGTLTIDPLTDPLVEGLENVTVTVDPGTYQISGGSAEVTILDSNHEPAWTSATVNREDGTEDSAYLGTSLATSASDPDADTLTFGKVSGPDWLIVHPDGSLAGTPDADDLGPNSFVVSATDPGGLSANATLEIEVRFANLPPEFDASPLAFPTAFVGFPYSGGSLESHASDENEPQGDVLTFSKIDGPAWLDVAPDGTLGGTPPPGAIGPNSFTVRVTDLASATADATVTIQVEPSMLYLDANGSDSGSGAGGNLDWDAAAVWTTDAAGVIATRTWVDGSIAILAAGTDATDSTITLSGSRLISGLTAEEGNTTLAGGGLTLVGEASPITVDHTLVVASPISGGGLIKSGTGTLMFTGGNTYNGDTTILQGVLELGATGRLYQNGPETNAVVTVSSGGTWRLPDFSPAGLGQLSEDRERRIVDGGVLEITGPGHSSPLNFTVTASGGTLKYTSAGQTLTLAGNPTDNLRIDGPWTIDATGDVTISEILDGTGSILKTGGGRLEISSNSPITGPLHVTQGALILSGSLSNSSAQVDSGASVSGDGTLSSTLDVSGTLAPGNQVGEITCGPLVMRTGSRIEWQISDWNGSAGIGYDQISAASLDLTGATNITLALEASSLPNFSETARSFALIHTTSGITGFLAGSITVDAGALPGTAGEWSLRLDGDQLMLDYTPPPPLELWQIAEFGPDAENPLIAGEQADPDADGTVNLLEYALGTDPNLADVAAITYDFETVEGTDYLRVTIPRNPDATDVTYLVEATSDPSVPASWTHANTLIEVDTPSLLVVRDTLAGPRRLLRLRVTH